MTEMSLRKVIERHYSVFSTDVNPVALASRLDDLTMRDRESILCQNRSFGRDYGNKELVSAICSKVDWKDLYEALIKEKYRRLAKLLHEEYYKQNPTALRIEYNEPLESRTEMAESDVKFAEFIPEVSSSNEKISSKIHLKHKSNVSSSSCHKDASTSNSQPLVPANNHYTIYIRDLNNSILQIGDQNEIKNDKSEENLEDDTTYEIVPEVHENRSSSEIDIERSPDPQDASSGQLAEQSIADDASQTSNLLSANTGNSNVRNAAYERAVSNGSQTLLKASVTSEIECSQCIEKAPSNNNLSPCSPGDLKRLGIDLRHNGHSEGENHAGDEEDETFLKKTLSDD